MSPVATELSDYIISTMRRFRISGAYCHDSGVLYIELRR